MAKTILDEAGVIKEIHGRVGNFLYTVRNGVQHVRMVGPHEYRRRSKLTAGEVRARALFAQAQAEVTRLKENGDPRLRKVIFKEVYAKLRNRGVA